MAAICANHRWVVGMGRKGHERGLALFSVLMLLVMVMVVIASMSLATRHILRQDALMHALPSMEDALDVRATVVTAVLGQYPKAIHHVPSLQTAAGLGDDVVISDEMAKLNVNALHPDHPHHQAAGLIFVRLLQQLNTPKAQAEILKDELIDYLDADDVRADGSLERAQAQISQPNVPMYYANAPMQRADELIYLPSMRGELLVRLLPYVAANPIAQEADAHINVNGADGPLLSALIGQPLSPSDIGQIQQRQAAGGFQHIDEFWQIAPFNRQGATDSLSKDVDIKAMTTTQTHLIGLYLRMDDDNKVRRVFYLLKGDKASGNEQGVRRFEIVQRRVVANFS